MDRAQGATEYIIIMGVVIVVAIVVVAALGSITGIGKGVTAKVTATYWLTSDLSIPEYAISASGTDKVMIKNNLKDDIVLRDVVINGVDLENSTTALSPGATVTYSGNIGKCTSGGSFSYPVSIYYQNYVTGAYYNFTGDGNNLKGICAI
jgi:hypothetical protein